MRLFEDVCAKAGAVATEMEDAAKQLQRAARAMGKAALEGNPAKMRQAMTQVRQASDESGRVGAKIDQDWPLSDEDVTAYLEKGFVNELIAATKSLGITLSRLEDRLAAFPVIVQILPTQRAVRLDAIRLTSLRPSVVAERIRTQIKKARSRPEQFIEILFKTYKLVSDGRADKGVTLVDVYDALTLLPDARRSYSKAEFARDVYLLDTSRVRVTNSGATVSFPSATGTRGASRTLLVVPPDGMPKYYYGLRFQGNS